VLETDGATAAPEKTAAKQSAPQPAQQAAPTASVAATPTPRVESEQTFIPSGIHAGPSVRKLAREFGVDLNAVSATGPKQRILKEDVQVYVKSRLSQSSAGGGVMGLPSMPSVDFAKFGPIETQALSRIKKISGKNLHRNWLLVPHVTQFGEADITEMEDFRVARNAMLEKKGIKITPLVFILKAVVSALKQFPQFNASLDPTGENLILKQYFHVGVAVDTPDGLVVPVIRDVDQKSVTDLAVELTDVSKKARDKKLTSNDMQGGTFSISSLGGIGGTAFTPIVNVPEVAILGVSKSSFKPIYQDGHFIPRLMLPLAVSYDHRVIDGADGARFMVHLTNTLADIRNLLL
jgi:pyruvate dehydrogenase E2 component (dihydrolipoamide acetyltransferase)